MNTFADKSLPPQDRDERPAADPSLIAALQSTGLSNAEIGKGIGYSSSYVSQYLNNKFPADLLVVEQRIREFLRDRNITRVSGVATIETEVSRFLCRKLEEARINRELCIITAPAGTGKSRSLGLYLITHTLAIAFRVTAMHTGMAAMANDLCDAADITWPPARRSSRFRRVAPGKKAPAPAPRRRSRWDTIVEKTTGSDRLLVVDDAHELGPRALQCCVDYHEVTGNPVVLLGKPELRKKLLGDDRRASRVDQAPEIPVKEPRALVEHLVKELAPDANSQQEQLIDLCLQVAARPGAFRSVEKQLQLAAKQRRKVHTPAQIQKLGPDNFEPSGIMTWTAAFRAAHLRLLRNYTLN